MTLYSFILLLFFFYNNNYLAAQNLEKLSYDELDSLMYLEYDKGDFRACLPYVLAGREKAKKEFGNQDTIYALYCSDIGSFYTLTGQYQLAEPLFLESKTIYGLVKGKEHPDYAASLNNLSQLYEYMGDFEQSERTLLEGKDIRAKSLGTAHPDYGRSLNNLAFLYLNMGSYAQAEPLLLEAKNIWEHSLGKTHPDYSTCLNNLANVNHHLENYVAAEQSLRECIAIDSMILGQEHPNYASSLSNLALLYVDMENYKKATPLMLKAKSILEKSLGKRHNLYGSCLKNLAKIYSHNNDNVRAEKLLLEGIEIEASSLGEQHLSYAISLNDLALVYLKMSKFEKAWDHLHKAIKSFSGLEISSNISNDWADSLLQANYPSNKHLESMSVVLQHIYSFIQKTNFTNSKEQLFIVSNLANKLLKKSKDRFANEQDKLRTLSFSYQWMNRSLKVIDLEKQTDLAFELIENNKANLLLEATKTEQAYQLGDLPDSLAKKEQQLLKEYATLEGKSSEKRSEQDQALLVSDLNKTGQKIIDFKKNIETKFPKYAALKYEQNSPKITDIQQQLLEDAALIEYAFGDSSLYIVYIEKTKHFILEQPLDIDNLNYRVHQLHHLLNDYEQLTKEKTKSFHLYAQLAHWFYKHLVEPVLNKKTTNIKQLIFVTDEILGHLPFETFLVKSADQVANDYTQLHYLINDYRISYNFSAALWRETKTIANSSKKSGQLLAMAANYKIKLDTTQLHLHLPIYNNLRSNLNPLPAARKEIEVLEKKYQGFFAFDTLASEKTFKTKAQDYSIIHLALHGILNHKAPILSSLAFSEDADSVENNFLQAFEISKMNLNAELVVLSACETGYGKFEKGNGIASLARAFMFAGTASIVVSLWQVNDFATASLMENFYDNLAAGMRKDEALRQAKLQYLQNAKGIVAHPAFWSPFILIGDDSPIYIAKKEISWYWIIGGITALLLVLTIGIFFRKKQAQKV